MKNTMTNPVFVFTTSMLGYHHRTLSGKHALEYYLPSATCFGPSQDCYAIPTLDYEGNPLPTHDLLPFVHYFIMYALRHPQKKFFVNAFENHSAKEIAPMFKNAPENVLLPPTYMELL